MTMVGGQDICGRCGHARTFHPDQLDIVRGLRIHDGDADNHCDYIFAFERVMTMYGEAKKTDFCDCPSFMDGLEWTLEEAGK